MRVILSFLLVFSFIISCNENRKETNELLKLAGNSCKELEKVIKHYKHIGDKQKLEAAYFLIANMRDKYSLEGEALKPIFDVYSDILNIYNTGIKNFDILDSITGYKLDSIENQYGPITPYKLNKKYDFYSVNADNLIENIDLAFDVWEKYTWSKHINFNEFCEYILPYRIRTEPLQNWRSYLYKKYRPLLDTLTNCYDPKIIARILCDTIIKDWKRLDNFDKAPFYPGIVDIDQYKGGTCEHHYLFLTALLRTFGIAVTIDHTPQWRNYPGGHSWLMLIDTTGKPIAFNPGNPMFWYTNNVPMGSTGSTSKVYRLNYKINLPKGISDSTLLQSLPPIFTTDNLTDASHEYSYPQASLSIPVKSNGKIMLLFNFGYTYNLSPIAFKLIKGNKVVFDHLGYPAVYVPVIKNADEDEKFYPISINIDKSIMELKPNHSVKREIVLHSKFPMSDSMTVYSHEMINSMFQASDNPEFNNPVNLYVIHDTTEYFKEAGTYTDKAFRYVRYISSEKGRINVAEINFWTSNPDGMNKKLEGKLIHGGKLTDWKWENAFDGNIATNVSALPDSWVGYDLGKPVRITKVMFLPRNDLNNVEPGDIYELSYFDKVWISLGSTTANDYWVKYKNVPDNALMVLRDLTKGKQERIFTFKNNRQVWW